MAALVKDGCLAIKVYGRQINVDLRDNEINRLSVLFTCFGSNSLMIFCLLFFEFVLCLALSLLLKTESARSCD